MAGIDVRDLDESLVPAAGELLATTGQRDVLGAALVLLAQDGDDIVTTDLDDLGLLATAGGLQVELFHP